MGSAPGAEEVARGAHAVMCEDGGSSLALATAKEQLADIVAKDGRFSEASVLLREAVAVRRLHGAKYPQGIANALRKLRQCELSAQRCASDLASI